MEGLAQKARTPFTARKLANESMASGSTNTESSTRDHEIFRYHVILRSSDEFKDLAQFSLQ